MVSLGREGYRRYAKAIFETAFAMQKAVRSHPELRLMGKPTWCFSFTSDAFDIYHVNDFMKTRGWRFNGQQYPNAIHMCVTRPQTQPGVVETFTRDLDEAVRYALNPPRDMPATGAIYQLESRPDLNSTNWFPVTNTPAIIDGQNTVLVPPVSDPQQFYRLRKTN